MDILKPTIKRDISLFSILSWQKGYLHYLKQKLGWSYPIYFYYNGRQVNFYHKESDFHYFKTVITQKIIQDKKLFKRLNNQFQKDVILLKQISQTIDAKNLPEISNLIGKVMAFYMFIVSDSFVNTVPKAWESRHLSQEILYQVDEKVEQFVITQLKNQSFPPFWSHLLTIKEIHTLFLGEKINASEILQRQTRYILSGKDLITDIDFSEFCRRNNLTNPDESQTIIPKTIFGSIACKGIVLGKAKIVLAQRHLAKIQLGDILISTMTNANYTQAFQKAAAIVTDEGGITSHAAILARELQKPCIIGTKIATQVFQDGDLLQVDANSGIISKLP